MTLSDLASLGSFVSGIAVLFSFVFLALQLRQGNVNQRALIQLERSNRIIDGVYNRAEPHLSDVVSRGNRGDTSMSPDEIETYLQVSYAVFLTFENTYLQLRLGTLRPEQWDTAVARLKSLLLAPGRRVAWKKYRHMFGSDFAEAIDQIVSQARLSNWEEPSASWASDLAEEMRSSAR